jgi:membrane-associated phospholipid phosphatase
MAVSSSMGGPAGFHAIVARMEAIEKAIIHWLTCTVHHPVLGTVFRVVQSDALAIPLFLLAACVVARRDGRTALRTVASGAAAFGVGMLVASLLWATVPRERPPHAYERLLRTDAELATCAEHPEAFPVRDRVSSRRSFPSRHGITVGAFVTVLFLASWRLGVLAILYGSLVAVGRVYVGRHWPSDVLAGLVLGTLFAVVMWRVAPRVGGWVTRLPGLGGLAPRR